MKAIIEELENILLLIEIHPLYDSVSSEDELNEVGGDTAFITIDIAKNIRNIIDKLRLKSA